MLTMLRVAIWVIAYFIKCSVCLNWYVGCADCFDEEQVHRPCFFDSMMPTPSIGWHHM